MTRRCIRTSRGLELIPCDPPLLDGDIEISLEGLTEERVPVSRTTTPRLDEVVLAELLVRARSV